MRAEARDFELAWAARERGDAMASPSGLAGLLVVAQGLGTLASEAEPAPAERAWARLAEELDHTLVPLEPRVDSWELPPRRPGRGALVRAIAVAAAVFAVIASVSLRSHPGSFLYPLRTGLERTALFFDGSLHLRIADARLGDLVGALEHGPQGDAPALAAALVSERAAAVADGKDVSSLDREIRTEVPTALAHVSAPIAQRVENILGSLLPPSPTSQAPQTTTPTPATGSDGDHSGSSGEHSSGPGDGSAGSSNEGSTEGSGRKVSGDQGSGDTGGPTTGDTSGGPGDGGGSDSTDGGSNTSGSNISGSTDGGSTDGGSNTSPSTSGGDAGSSSSGDGLDSSGDGSGSGPS